MTLFRFKNVFLVLSLALFSADAEKKQGPPAEKVDNGERPPAFPVDGGDDIFSGPGVKIVGGIPVTNSSKYTFFGLLGFTSGGVDYLYCGSSLIARDWLITAAHCDPRLTEHVDINVCGANCDTSERFGFSRVIIHPQYNSRRLDYDFALVKLNGQSTKTTAAIDTNGEDNLSWNYDPAVPKSVMVAGYGTTSSGGDISSVLREVEVKAIPQDTCKYETKMRPREILDTMICAGEENGGEDSCQGDSGGPLYDAENQALIGLVSWGYGCAQAGYPGVYARVSSAFPFITENICDDTADTDFKDTYCGSIPTTTTPPAPVCSGSCNSDSDCGSSCKCRGPRNNRTCRAA